MNDQERIDGTPTPEASHDDAQESDAQESLAEAIPGLARIYASAWLRTAEWAVESSFRAGSRVMRTAISGDSPAALFEGAGADLREYARRLVGVVDPDGAMGGESDPTMDRPRGDDCSTEALRERGTELLRQSADVHFEEDTHPAYARILEDLTPDEGRILRLLAQEGPQPAVDVRGGWLPFNIGSELVALGLSMIAEEAGCRNLDRVPAYLNNLNRLGLVWFSREPVEDRNRYQVLEAQPDVTAAMRKAGRGGSTVRRSIHLTPFGEDFCDVCLPLDTAELDALDGEGEAAVTQTA
ncbi:MAG: Abi-alpha family protein [Actinomycetota bacterium]